MIVASTFSRLPSAFLAPMRPVPDGSTMLPWFYGLVGLAVPFASILGVVGGVRRARSGNRLGWAAAAWCVLTAVTSVLLWSNVIADEHVPTVHPSPLTVGLRAVTPVDAVPSGVTWPRSDQPGPFAAIDVVVTNESDEAAPFAVDAIWVLDDTERVLVSRTVEDDLLDTEALAGGATVAGRLYVPVEPGHRVTEVRYEGAGPIR